jgi:hypothetical protein
VNAFVSGVLVTGYLVAGTFFLRFYRQSHDRLFVFFAVAFWTLAAQRGALAVTGPDPRGAGWLYAVRLAAFLLILVAIVDKNRAARGGR